MGQGLLRHGQILTWQDVILCVRELIGACEQSEVTENVDGTKLLIDTNEDSDGTGRSAEGISVIFYYELEGSLRGHTLRQKQHFLQSYLPLSTKHTLLPLEENFGTTKSSSTVKVILSFT